MGESDQLKEDVTETEGMTPRTTVKELDPTPGIESSSKDFTKTTGTSADDSNASSNRIKRKDPYHNTDEATQNHHDNNALNKFSNDGSFLATFMAQQATHQAVTVTNSTQTAKASTCPASKQSCSSSQKSAKKQKNTDDRARAKEGQLSYIDEGDDEAAIKAKEEFLNAMRIMEEAGLVTEKGIGAGMVK